MPTPPPPVRFGVIGLNHAHINDMTALLLEAGAEMVAFFADEDDLAAEYASRFSSPRRAGSKAEILEDSSIHLIASAAISDERGPLGIASMRHGKDFMSDNPAFTSLDHLEEPSRVQREPARTYSAAYSG